MDTSVLNPMNRAVDIVPNNLDLGPELDILMLQRGASQDIVPTPSSHFRSGAVAARSLVGNSGQGPLSATRRFTARPHSAGAPLSITKSGLGQSGVGDFSSSTRHRVPASGKTPRSRRKGNGKGNTATGAPKTPGMKALVEVLGEGAEATKARAVVRWLQSLGISIRDPSALLRELSPEFCDGVVLCRVVEAVEHIRGSLSGFVPNPKNGAQCLNNIRSALRVLRKKKEMSVDLLWSEEDVRAGESSVILPLLDQIRHAYNHHILRSGIKSGTRRPEAERYGYASCAGAGSRSDSRRSAQGGGDGGGLGDGTSAAIRSLLLDDDWTFVGVTGGGQREEKERDRGQGRQQRRVVGAPANAGLSRSRSAAALAMDRFRGPGRLEVSPHRPSVPFR